MIAILLVLAVSTRSLWRNRLRLNSLFSVAIVTLLPVVAVRLALFAFRSNCVDEEA